jgi:aspartyl-tRNA(Asn)/glutamyl-tRNA(Gln) amidotransferase subunit A
MHEPLLKEHAADYSPPARTQLEIGMMTRAVDYLRAQRVRSGVLREFADAFAKVDVIVCPTVAHVAPADNPHPGMLVRGRTRAVRRTGPFNLAGLPAISVPMGTAEDGLPVGLQIAGPWLQDARVMRVAAAFEKRSDWTAVCPPGVRAS